MLKTQSVGQDCSRGIHGFFQEVQQIEVKLLSSMFIIGNTCNTKSRLGNFSQITSRKMSNTINAADNYAEQIRSLQRKHH